MSERRMNDLRGRVFFISALATTAVNMCLRVVDNNQSGLVLQGQKVRRAGSDTAHSSHGPMMVAESEYRRASVGKERRLNTSYRFCPGK